jgi:hypothetical protein
MNKEMAEEAAASMASRKERDRSTTPQSEGWALGPDGWKDVVAYVNDTPELGAMLVELGLYEQVEHSGHGEEAADMIFTIANHWRERELRISAQSEKAPMFDAVQLSEARYYRESRDPIGILARAILRANGEMK